MNILYIEDNLQLAKTVKDKFSQKYNFDVAETGAIGIKYIENKEYDLIILDYFLPDTDGLKISKIIREFDPKVPILIFTTNDSKEDVVKTLDAGADDYLTKPFDFSELEARVRALIRRTTMNKSYKTIKVGEIVMDTAKQILLVDDHLIDLSRQEFMLLRYILINRGKLVSRQELYEHVWGKDDFYNSNTIDVHIKRIRKKISRYSEIDYIKSIYGLGYRVVGK